MVAISGSAPPPPPPRQSSQQASLSEEQQTLITETLSQYDADCLSEADAQSIVEVFSEANLAPGKAFADALSEAGFDAKEIGDLAGMGPNQESMGAKEPPAPPKSEGQGFTDEMLTTLESLLAEYEGRDLDSDTIDSITATMEELFGLDKSGRLLDVSA